MLRIAVGSIQELVAARPLEFQMPQCLPASHQRNGDAGGSTGGGSSGGGGGGGRRSSQQHQATDGADEAEGEGADEAEGEGEEEQGEDFEEDEAAPAATVVDRTGMTMEVQGCGPECDYVCDCEWEVCLIVADHGRSCDVCMSSDEERFDGVLNRYLRMPAAAVGKRSRRGNP